LGWQIEKLVNMEEKVLRFAPKAALVSWVHSILGECGVMVKGDAILSVDSPRRAVIMWGPRGDASV
jgi:hypothetical protein